MKKAEKQAAKRLQRLINKNFEETDIKMELSYKALIENSTEDRKQLVN